MQTDSQKNGLIYGLEDRPPMKDTLFAAMQHLLAIFVAIITPSLIVSGALGFDVETTSYLVSMSLLVSGIATFIQCKRLGGVGCGLLCVQGTSFSFISPIIMAGAIGGGGLGSMSLMRGHGRNQVIVLYVAVIILVILVQIIQSIGTALCVKTDKRITHK